jgi:hypothetical protein
MLGSNSERGGMKPATNRLSYATTNCRVFRNFLQERMTWMREFKFLIISGNIFLCNESTKSNKAFYKKICLLQRAHESVIPLLFLSFTINTVILAFAFFNISEWIKLHNEKLCYFSEFRYYFKLSQSKKGRKKERKKEETKKERKKEKRKKKKL